MVPQLKGWSKVYSGDAITFYPPEGSAVGGIRYRERVRPLSRVSYVVEQMLAGRAGALAIPEAEASGLGLGPSDAVAVFASIPAVDAGHWSVAVVTSTEPLRAQERAIAVRIDSQFLQSAFDRLQVAQRVRQPFPSVAGDEAAVNQPAELGLDVRQRQRQRHVHPAFQPFVDVEDRRQDLFNLLGHLNDRVVQLGADLLLQPCKVFLLPNRAAVFGDQLVEIGGLHSTGSTNTWTLPPQARPTSQAVSSATPKWRSCGRPVCRLSIPAS